MGSYPMADGLIRRGTSGHIQGEHHVETDTQTQREDGHAKMEAETGATLPPPKNI